jgi:hypothetical protein
MKRHKKGKPHKTRGPSKFRKTEATRLVRAALDAGLSVNRVECDPTGKISVFAGKPEMTGESDNDLDKWLGKHDAHSTQGN